jgi:hypothetical protein
LHCFLPLTWPRRCVSPCSTILNEYLPELPEFDTVVT